MANVTSIDFSLYNNAASNIMNLSQDSNKAISDLEAAKGWLTGELASCVDFSGYTSAIKEVGTHYSQVSSAIRSALETYEQLDAETQGELTGAEKTQIEEKPKNFLSSLCVGVTSVLSGVVDIVDSVVDAGAMVVGEVTSSVVGIFDKEAGQNIKEGVKNYVAVDWGESASKWFYEDTALGREINATSHFTYDSGVANGLKMAGNIAGNIALNFLPGGAIITGVASAAQAMGRSGEKAIREGANLDQAFGVGLANGVVGFGTGYVGGQIATAARSAVTWGQLVGLAGANAGVQMLEPLADVTSQYLFYKKDQGKSWSDVAKEEKLGQQLLITGVMAAGSTFAAGYKNVKRTKAEQRATAAAGAAAAEKTGKTIEEMGSEPEVEKIKKVGESEGIDSDKTAPPGGTDDRIKAVGDTDGTPDDSLAFKTGDDASGDAALAKTESKLDELDGSVPPPGTGKDKVFQDVKDQFKDDAHVAGWLDETQREIDKRAGWYSEPSEHQQLTDELVDKVNQQKAVAEQLVSDKVISSTDEYFDTLRDYERVRNAFDDMVAAGETPSVAKLSPELQKVFTSDKARQIAIRNGWDIGDASGYSSIQTDYPFKRFTLGDGQLGRQGNGDYAGGSWNKSLADGDATTLDCARQAFDSSGTKAEFETQFNRQYARANGLPADDYDGKDLTRVIVMNNQERGLQTSPATHVSQGTANVEVLLGGKTMGDTSYEALVEELEVPKMSIPDSTDASNAGRYGTNANWDNSQNVIGDAPIMQVTGKSKTTGQTFDIYYARGPAGMLIEMLTRPGIDDTSREFIEGILKTHYNDIWQSLFK